jgi:hypothetical protein
MLNRVVRTAGMCCLFMLAASTSAALGAVTSSAVLRQIPGRLEDSLRLRFDRNALPHGSSDASFDNGQMFKLSGRGVAPLIVAPISFDTATHDNGNDMRFDCGVFFLDTRGHRSFARTTPPRTPLDCMRLLALGAVPHDGARPRLLFLYDMSGKSSEPLRTDERTEIYVLVWNRTERRYAADWSLSRWLTRGLPHPTLAAVRAAIASRDQRGRVEKPSGGRRGRADGG